MAELLSSSIKEICISSDREIDDIWVRKNPIDPNQIQSSYDRLSWAYDSWILLAVRDYHYLVISVPWDKDDDTIYDLHDRPLSQSIQAKEAQPKVIPPIFEERDI